MDITALPVWDFLLQNVSLIDKADAFKLDQLSHVQGASVKVQIHINQYEPVLTSCSSLVTLAHVSALVLCSLIFSSSRSCL